MMFYNPAFTHFLQDIHNPAFEVPEENIVASKDFIVKSSALYPLEKELREAFLPYLNKATGHTFIASPNSDRTEPDGIVVAQSSGCIAKVCIREDNNEIMTGCDPGHQAVLSSRHISVQKEVCVKVILYPDSD
jgi:hypothetical protein